MPLLEAEERLLRAQYDALAEFLLEDNKKKWPSVKENIIQFCVEHEIRLYNIGSLKLYEATQLLTDLLTHFTFLDFLVEEERGAWKVQALEWKKIFDRGLQKAHAEFVHLHEHAYLNVGDQYLRTQKVLPSTLLTIRDMNALFTDPGFFTDDILSFEPFSLTEHSIQQAERLKKLIQENDKDKTIFMPVNHQGHWFYLLKQHDDWFIKDSQPFIGKGELSPRQESILHHGTDFINQITNAHPSITFETTGEQDNDHDCGTRVTNAYRMRVDKHYEPQTHRDILIQLAQKQVLDKERLPKNIEEIFGQIPIIAPQREVSSPKSSSESQKEVSSPKLPSAIQIEVPIQRDSAKPKTVPKKFSKENFLRLLNPIEEKRKTRLCQYPAANRAVRKLKERITEAANAFYNTEFSVNSLEHFETQCSRALNRAEKALGTHRGVLGELFAGIKNFFVVLGKSLAGSNEPEHRLKFFDGRTDSAKILRDLREDVQSKQAEYRSQLR